jgi:NitT/TauT family transport system substrate-binding protein
MRRTQHWILAAVLVFVAIGTYFWITKEKGKEQPYKVGLVTWIGYAPLYIAKDKGYFDAEGLDVEIRNMDQPGTREAAFSAGNLDFFPNTPDAFVIDNATHPLPGKIIAAFDRSFGADGLIVKSDTNSALDLKGKSVGFEKGITSHYLLLWYLHQNGMTGADIKQINLSANDAGRSFLAGQLDAAATWEPWLTKARETEGSKVLIDSSRMDDRIVDVLMVSNRVLANPDAARRFMRAWYKGLEFLESHSDEADILLGRKWFSSKPEEVRAMRATVRFMTEAESKKYVATRLGVIGDEISDMYFMEGLIARKVSLVDAIRSDVVK